MGGLACDENGETDVAGLFAIGECSCISVHGANRLGGNSLLETIVFGKRAGELANERVSGSTNRRSSEKALKETLLEEQTAIEALKRRATGERQIAIRREMQETMTEHVGVFRDEVDLSEAIDKLAGLKERYRRVVLDHGGSAFNCDLVDTLELGGMLELAEVTAFTALERTECRGSHWRTDHLGRDDDHWLRHSLAMYNHGGRPRLAYKDVIITDYPPQEREY
jgi:succinate dehydrogenase / fumarate reductase flavoprotein subunit